MKHTIVDSQHGHKALVTNSGALVVTTVPAPPELANQYATPTGQKRFQYLNGLLGTSGFASGTTNGNVNGSITPVELYAGAATEYDIIIHQCVIVIADSTVAMNKFGALTALTNGIDIQLRESGITTSIIQKAKSGGQVLIQSGMLMAFGSGGDVNEITAYEGNSDALVIGIPFHTIIPGGIRIAKGGTDKLSLIINDDLSGLDIMRVRILGYKEYS